MATSQPQPKIIQQEYPNQPIFLYSGSAELIDGENIIQGEGWIQISWYPFPKITVEFIYDGEGIIDDIELKSSNTELKLTESKNQPKVKVYLSNRRYYETKKRGYFGYLKEPFIEGITDDLSSVTFQIANFLGCHGSNDEEFEYDDEDNEIEIHREGWLMDLFAGQFIFDYDNWHIVLANLDNSYEFQDRLEAEGGYGITHICKVEHLDGKTFDLKEGYKIINAFIYYLSFVRGIWIAPFFLLGFDAEGNQILEEWDTPTIIPDSWQSPDYSWYGEHDGITIFDLFPGFMKKWQDETWQEVIQNSIQWYIESYKHTNGYNTSIILVHSALEKLAWTHLKSNNYISPDGFKKLTFDDKLRLLLKTLNISLEPIDGNWQIVQLANKYNWLDLDTVSIIGQVRNSLIHPKISKTENKIKLTEMIMEEVFVVAYKYLVKCLFKLFDYPYQIDYLFCPFPTNSTANKAN
ncbi:MAG: hypothetical protein F6K17_06415 [Okeania sp. SIO3C4]|nr:hypothetical protein [Okeania sp. SIO3B3]NER02288.1 hypothetical protein [Okeania sp. SIO3C4]